MIQSLSDRYESSDWWLVLLWCGASPLPYRQLHHADDHTTFGIYSHSSQNRIIVVEYWFHSMTSWYPWYRHRLLGSWDAYYPCWSDDTKSQKTHLSILMGYDSDVTVFYTTARCTRHRQTTFTRLKNLTDLVRFFHFFILSMYLYPAQSCAASRILPITPNTLAAIIMMMKPTNTIKIGSIILDKLSSILFKSSA